MSNYFSASEARNMTNSVINGVMTKELENIYGEITKAIQEGRNSIKYSNVTFSKVTIEFLKNKGFKVEHFSGVQWDPADDTTISWE